MEETVPYAEEEHVHGPSDGQVGCGGGLPCGVQNGDQGDELQLQAGGLADGGDDSCAHRSGSIFNW